MCVVGNVEDVDRVFYMLKGVVVNVGFKVVVEVV